MSEVVAANQTFNQADIKRIMSEAFSAALVPIVARLDRLESHHTGHNVVVDKYQAADKMKECKKCGGSCKIGGDCESCSSGLFPASTAVETSALALAAGVLPQQSTIRALGGLHIHLPECGGGSVETGDGPIIVHPGVIIPPESKNCTVAVGSKCGVRKWATGTPIYWSVEVLAAQLITGTPELGTRFAFAVRLPVPDVGVADEGMAGVIVVEEGTWFNAAGVSFVPNRFTANGSVWEVVDGTTDDNQLHQFGSNGTAPARLQTTDGRCSCSKIYAVMPQNGIAVFIIDSGALQIQSITLSGNFIVGTPDAIACHCKKQRACEKPPWSEILQVDPLLNVIDIDTDIFG